MPLRVTRFLFAYLPMTAFYAPWAASTLLCTVMTPQNRLRHPRLLIFLFLSFISTAAGIVMLFFPNVGTWVLQAGIFVSAMLMFREPFRKKLIGFFVVIFILVVPETIACNLFLMVHSVFLRKPLSSTSLNSLTSIPDMLLLNAIYVPFGITVVIKAASFLKKYSYSIHLETLALLVVPTQACTLTTGLIQHHTDSPYFAVRFLAYWLIALGCFVPIYKGFQNIRRLEEEHAALDASMHLVQKQLEYSREMEKEFQSIRKWNHDMENHLFSMNYLINSGKYKQASEYLDSLFPQEKDDIRDKSDLQQNDPDVQ